MEYHCGYQHYCSVSNATLSRFFALHYLLPFVLIALAIVHLIYLHSNGGSNPLGITTNVDKLPFHPYFVFKDVFGFVLVIIALTVFVGWYPNILGRFMAVFYSNIDYDDITICWEDSSS